MAQEADAPVTWNSDIERNGKLAKAMYARRLALSLTQKRAASESGIKKVTWLMFEHGMRTPSGETLANIAATLDCDPADLTDDVGLIVGAWLARAEPKHIKRLARFLRENPLRY